MVATVGSQLLYAWSKEIGELFGDTVGHRPVGITVAIVAVWLLGCAINVIQTPLRVCSPLTMRMLSNSPTHRRCVYLPPSPQAIVADVAAEEQQETGQSLASIFQALGGIVGFLVSYIWYPVAIMRPYFVASSVTLVVTTIITCCVAKEAQHKNEETISGCCNSIGRVFTDVFRGIGMMPVGMRRICILQFCTWGAWFMFNPNWPAWMGSFIYGGSPQHPGTAPTAANLRYKRCVCVVCVGFVSFVLRVRRGGVLTLPFCYPFAEGHNLVALDKQSQLVCSVYAPLPCQRLSRCLGCGKCMLPALLSSWAPSLAWVF